MDTTFAVGFRADASKRIGTGHIIRCLTLAEEIQLQGGRCYFICRHIPATLAQMILTAGHQLIRLTAQDTLPNTSKLDHADWLGTNQSFDAEETVAAIASLDLDWMMVDHYALDQCWESLIATTGVRIGVIDDLADRTHSCKIFINQNLVSNPESLYINKLPHDCKWLIGPEYALLRDEFLHQQVSRPVRKALNSMLVFFGGIDTDNLTITTIAALAELHWPEVSVDVVIGSLHPHKAAVEQQCLNLGFTCHIQTNRMAQLMAKADIAIGAGGSASWERAYMGLPSVLVSVAENQTAIAQAVSQQGAACFLGGIQEFSKEAIQQALLGLRQQPQTLEAMSKQCLLLCDGLGKKRIVDTMQAQQ